MNGLFNFIEQDCKAGFVILFACMVFTMLASLLDLWTALEVVRVGKRKAESRPLMKTATHSLTGLFAAVILGQKKMRLRLTV